MLWCLRAERGEEIGTPLSGMAFGSLPQHYFKLTSQGQSLSWEAYLSRQGNRAGKSGCEFQEPAATQGQTGQGSKV